MPIPKIRINEIELEIMRAFGDTFMGKLEIEAIDRNNWNIQAGGRTWSSFPDQWVEFEYKAFKWNEPI